MTVLRAFVIIIASGLAGAGIGGGLGYAIGVLAPGVYLAQFSRAAALPGFNPAHVGLALGLPQGMVAGVLIGCVVVLAVAIASRFRLPPVGGAVAPTAWDRVRGATPRPSGPSQPSPTDITAP